MKKKPMIILAISLCILIAVIFLVVNINKNKKDIIKMDTNYINTNYEIDLFADKKENNLELYSVGKYLGSDKFAEDPKIKITVNCMYTYTDADEQYTDMLSEDIVLTKDDSNYNGKANINLNRNEVDGYSCYYIIKDTTGSYFKKD